MEDKPQEEGGPASEVAAWCCCCRVAELRETGVTAHDHSLDATQPKQAITWRGQIRTLYGGAAGGSKGDALVIEGLPKWAFRIKALSSTKTTFPQLAELVSKSLNYTGGVPRGGYNAQRPGPSQAGPGSCLRIHAVHKDRTRYQGQAYDSIAFREKLTRYFTWEVFLPVSTNRPNGPGTGSIIRCQRPGGGVGHGWVRAVCHGVQAHDDHLGRT